MSGARRGRFISLEGGEGAGKSTQCKRLAAYLRSQGLDVIETREPGGSPGAEAIRTLLLHSESDAWRPPAEALLFAAARSDHVDRVIRPALERGAWVISDRFVDSSRAYQGGADGIGDAAVLDLHRIGSGGLMPDRTILLMVDGTQSLDRRQGRGFGTDDRFEQRDAAFHDSVASAFAAIASQEPERVRVVDGSRSIDAVAADVIATVAQWL